MKNSTKKLTRIAVLSTIAFILMYLEFAIPIFPSFLRFDFSDVPALLGAFAMGPVAGVIIELIKNILILVFKGTFTGGVGELANFIIGISLVIPAGIIYKRDKCRKNALIGMIVGIITMTLTGAIFNYYILIPFYAKIMPIEAIINMGAVVNQNIVNIKTLVLYGITPYNIFKGVIISIITILLYKRLSRILHD